MNSPDMPGNLEYPLYLGLGSNSGDREHNIRDALRRLDMAFGRHYEALSDIIETEPWGFESEDMFLNAAVRYRLTVPRGTSDMQRKDNERRAAYGILAICKDIETSMGRIQGVEYGNDGKRVYRSRPIDIDILLFGDVVIREKDLTIPHPLMLQRDFVMIPLRQIASKEELDRIQDRQLQ